MSKCANCGLELSATEEDLSGAPIHDDGYLTCPPGFGTSAEHEKGNE